MTVGVKPGRSWRRAPPSRAAPPRDGSPIGPISLIALGGCALSMLAATLAIRLHDAGFSARAIGINASAGGAAALVVAPLLPAAAARFGTVRLLALALVLAAAALVGFALTRSFAPWLLLRAVEGGCATTMFVLGEYWITARVPDGRRGLVIGIYVAAVSASFAAGPLLLSVLSPRGTLPFFIGAALFVGAVLVLRVSRGGAPAPARDRQPPMLRCLAAAPALMTAAVLHGAVETAGLNLLPVVATAGGAPSRGALCAGLFIVGAGALQLPIGVLAGGIGRIRALRWLAALAAAGAFALAAIGVDHFFAFAVGLALWGGLVGSFYPVGLGDLPRRFGGDRLVGANAAFVLSYGIGTLVGPPLAGAAIDLAPRGGLFLMLAMLNVVYLVTSLASERRAT